MDSDIWAWNKVKIQLQHKQEIPYFYEREVWWTAIGRNIGFEEYGKGDFFARPVLIIRKFNRSFFLGVPTSTSGATGRYYQRISAGGGATVALLSQIRAFDAKRLLHKIGSVSPADFAAAQFKLACLVSPNSVPSLERGRGRNPFVI